MVRGGGGEGVVRAFASHDAALGGRRSSCLLDTPPSSIAIRDNRRTNGAGRARGGCGCGAAAAPEELTDSDDSDDCDDAAQMDSTDCDEAALVSVGRSGGDFPRRLGFPPRGGEETAPERAFSASEPVRVAAYTYCAMNS